MIQRRQKPPLALGFKELHLELVMRTENLNLSFCFHRNYSAENVLLEIKTITYSSTFLFQPHFFIHV